MKIVLDTPHRIEVTDLAYDEATGQLSFTPRVTRGQSAMRILYLRVEGVGGMEATALVTFNAKSGRLSLERLGIEAATPKCAFDVAPAEFAKRRQPKRAQGSAGSDGPPSEDTPTVASSSPSSLTGPFKR